MHSRRKFQKIDVIKQTSRRPSTRMIEGIHYSNADHNKLPNYRMLTLSYKKKHAENWSMKKFSHLFLAQAQSYSLIDDYIPSEVRSQSSNRLSSFCPYLDCMHVRTCLIQPHATSHHMFFVGTDRSY